MLNYNFYGVNIDTPLSVFHNTDRWNSSIIGKLNAQTNGQVYVHEIPITSQNAKYGWRVVDAYYSQEDAYMTYFRAYDLEGKSIPLATFGINYGGIPRPISGGFRYRPEFGNNYYIPIQNMFPTPEAGGYTVQVLDLVYPSEGLSFGIFKQRGAHQGLIISFRLFKLGDGYPNDIPVREGNL